MSADNVNGEAFEGDSSIAGMNLLVERSRLAALTAEVSLVMVGPGDLQFVLHQCCELMTKRVEAEFTGIWTINRGGRGPELKAYCGNPAHRAVLENSNQYGKRVVEHVAARKAPYLVSAPLYDELMLLENWNGALPASLAGYPLFVDDHLLGVMLISGDGLTSQPVLETLASTANIISLSMRRRVAELELREEKQLLEAQLRASEALAVDMDLERMVQGVTDEATRASGAQFGAFFYNVENATGESYMLYTISGVPREHFSKFPMPRNTKVFGPTFAGTGIVRVDDITKDPRYGKNHPHNGMPKGHLPVCSYLAVPVKSRSGEVLGGLFFGHAKPGVFEEKHERVIEAMARQAALAIDNARLYSRAVAAEVGAKRESQLSRAITDNASVALFIMNDNHQCVFMNPAAEKLTGFAFNEIVGKHLHSMIHHTRPDGTPYPVEECPLDKAFVENNQEKGEEVFVHKDGHFYDVAFTASPIRNGGEVQGTVIEVIDITAQKHAEAELRDARDRALTASRAKSAFLANMSHELRTPLNAIIGYSELLQENALEAGDQTLVNDLQRINSSGTHLLSLINDILDLSKIEAGKMDLFISSFNLCHLMDDIRASLELLIKKTGNHLTIVCPDSVGSVQADETKVRQVILNLTSNALKFTEKGSIEVDISRSTSMSGDTIVVRVSDSGIGISDEQMNTLFTDFTQGDPAATSRYGGTGLGLAISRRFCRLMGGDITVSSQPGEGTTFWASFPAVVKA